MTAFARAGLAETFFTTPGGHSICWCDPYTDEQLPVLSTTNSLLKDTARPPLFNVTKFYFYRNHVVGIAKDYFFIFDEGLEISYIFKTREEWNKNIRTKKLNPVFTQWLDLTDTPFLFTTPRYVIIILLIVTCSLILFPIFTLLTKKKLHCMHYTLLVASMITMAVTCLLNIYSF
jgi:hypothetical protein